MPSTSSASHRALTLMTSVYSLSPAFREASPFTALAIMASPLQLHPAHRRTGERSEEHTSELQSLMRISYAVFCLKKKTKYIIPITVNHLNLQNQTHTLL